ncbi:Uncharacterised protein [Vibrio cholerae]|nr:Uncharacterised protein [Vibrio cholerae]
MISATFVTAIVVPPWVIIAAIVAVIITRLIPRH